MAAGQPPRRSDLPNVPDVPALADVPDRMVAWCHQRLGSAPVASLMAPSLQMAAVYGLALADGRRVAVKVRNEDVTRAGSCVRAQRAAADRGFPCPRPLTDAELFDGAVLHAEEWCPGGRLLRGHDRRTAEAFAVLLARLVLLLKKVSVAPPLPNPPWVRWDHGGATTWPAQAFLDERDQSLLPPFVEEVARRATARLQATDLPCLLGHLDWETQNLRWNGWTPYVVHDWDSVGWLPEAAIAGAASGTFSSAETPTLAALDSSRSFLHAYQQQRGEPFTDEETQVAWAASLWPAAHNARGQSLFARPPVALSALEAQAAERLALADA